MLGQNSVGKTDKEVTDGGHNQTFANRVNKEVIENQKNLERDDAEKKQVD